MDELKVWLELAVEQHKSGNLDLAEPLYRKVLGSQPDHADAMYLLGTLLLQQGNFAGCVNVLEPLSKVRGDVADVHNNLGIALNGMGRLDEATEAFQRAIGVRPDYDQAHFNLGVLLEQRGSLDEAEHCYRQALEINPDDAQVLCNLGFILKSEERWDDAEDCYSKLLALRPESIEAAVNFGFVLVKQEKLAAAEEVFRGVLKRQPDYSEIRNNLSYIYERQGRLEEAVFQARRAVELRPDYAEGYNNLGTALRSLRRLDEASAAFRRAIELRPNFHLAEFNYGTTRLLAGDFLSGWPGYEQRALTQSTPPRAFAVPRWNGEQMPGKTLLVHTDQGFGDTIQFIRYLQEAKQVSGARVALECPPELHRLLRGFPGSDLLVAPGTPVACDAHFPLTSMPGLFHTTLKTIPCQPAYLRADATLTEHWRQRLEELAPGQFRVGIVWQGNPRHARDVNRSCHVSRFAGISEIPGVTLVSLQQESTGIKQLLNCANGPRVLELGSRLVDFADAAALVNQLDLVISVDTAMAHLAGALGKPTWTLLAYSADWRWLLDRTDNPWYPSLRVFRQPAPSDWEGLFDEMTAELRKLLTA